MQTWDLSPDSGDYVITAGRPVQTDSLRVAAFIRLKTHRRGWMYAPDDDYGSDFHLSSKRLTTKDNTAIENTGARALIPLTADRRALLINVTADASSRQGAGLQCDIYESSGELEELKLTGLGA